MRRRIQENLQHLFDNDDKDDKDDKDGNANGYLSSSSSYSSSKEFILNYIVDELDQGHLFENWPEPGKHDEDKLRLIQQLKELDSQLPSDIQEQDGVGGKLERLGPRSAPTGTGTDTVTTGAGAGAGLKRYVKTAKALLLKSKNEENPFENCRPEKPTGVQLQAPSSSTSTSSVFHDFEDVGMAEMPFTGFVLVAGGLGERLGYDGIKVALPVEITTEKMYLEYYCEYLLALQERARESSGDPYLELPLAIMTSDDTHVRTKELLQDNNNFGMEPGQITLIKQQKVPSLIDNDAHFALDENDPFQVATKPHGHGDVHTLMHRSGLAKRWLASGVRWILFFQDTNALAFRGFPAALGVSVHRNFAMNSVTVARRPGEAVGGICTLVNNTTGERLTINVEYNQIDSLLRSTANAQGDVPDKTGYSVFPGSINVLILKCDVYTESLEKSQGVMPEFVNPKYESSNRDKFKKPTRLETLMQDFPRLLPSSPAHAEGSESEATSTFTSAVGFTQLDRWMCFSAVKNNIPDAAKKLESSGFGESASSGEEDFYSTNRKLLGIAGCQIKTAAVDTIYFAGLPFRDGAKVVLAPSFGTTIREIQSRFPNPTRVSISTRSTLVLSGDIVIHHLNLDGALHVIAAPGAKVVIQNLTVKNQGSSWEEVAEYDESVSEIYRIRGFRRIEHEKLVIDAPNPGEVIIDR